MSSEWNMLWIVYGFMAAAVLFQTFYILKLKSELKLFKENEKIAPIAGTDTVRIPKRTR
jgi:phosphotransferase system  glucose/maltose/N-acetylglucosamine-specific IIC component